MMEFYRHTYPRAGKAHKCESCGREIPKGEKYSSEAGKQDGGMFTRKLCLVCDRMLREYLHVLNAEGEDDFTWRHMGEWLEDEYCYYCEHGKGNAGDCETPCLQCAKLRKVFEPDRDASGDGNGREKGRKNRRKGHGKSGNVI